MTAPAPAPSLQGCGLPQAWHGHSAWRVLECNFDAGHSFFSTWHAWQTDPQRPPLLHYVALTDAPAPLPVLRALTQGHPEWTALVDELATQWFGLLPGFHRLTLADGQLLFTLCVGELGRLLREQQFVADSVYLHPSPSDKTDTPNSPTFTVKALARCCRRGTRVAILSPMTGTQADWVQSGFVFETSHGALPGSHQSAEFAPAWTLKNTRNTFRTEALPNETCAVIGAGLAGASIAAAIARRGWQVHVLDQADAPAAEASGLPVGLLAPYSSTDNSALSRLSRAGIRLMLQQARQLLQADADWQATGVLERRVDGSPGLPSHWPTAGLDWSQPITPDHALQQYAPERTWRHGIEEPTPALWHSHGAWIKPAKLVRAWLRQRGITFHAKACVAGIRASGSDWELLNAQQDVLARVSRVVFANACAAAPLVQALQTSAATLNFGSRQLPVMHGVRGQLSWDVHGSAPDATFPPFPVNGAGSVIAQVPLDGDAPQKRGWFVGSSYQPDSQPPASDATKHGANLGRLQRLLPALGQWLAPQFATGQLHAFKNTRCVTSDRLPVLGPLYLADDPGVWICAGLGSRGLSFAALCAELLAAQWCAEPWPIEASLAQSLLALRREKKPANA